METVRLRLVFDDRHLLSKKQKSEGLKRSWFLLKPDLETISDLSSHLIRIFDLQHACPNGILLSMDGFILPLFESTNIFKDKDIIRVKRKAGTLTDVIRIGDEVNSLEDSEIVEKRPVLTGVKLLAHDEFEKETEWYQSEAEENEYDGPEDALHLETPSSGKTTSKKRKSSKKLQSAKRKRTKSNSPENSPKFSIEDAENDMHTESNQDCHRQGVLKEKSSHKKDRSSKRKGKLNIESTAEVGNGGTNIVESMPSGERYDQLQETGKKDVDASCVSEGKKFPSRSARRKKAKRKWLRELANSQKEELMQTHMPENGIHKKSPEHQQSDQNTDIEAEIVPIVVRPGHIRFEPLDEDQVIQQTQDPVTCSVLQENFQWNGTTSKKKGQKWGKERNSASRSNGYKDSREDSIEKYTIEEEEPVHDPIDFEKLKPLSCLPKEGDVVAYRLVELSSSWCPELSSFRVGKVLWYDSSSNRVMLVPVPDYPVFSEDKRDEEEAALQPHASLYGEDGSLEIDFPSLVEVRIFNHDNKEPVAAIVTGGSDEAPASHKEAVSDVRPDDNNQETHAPIIENGGPVNVWEEISQALSEKKTQLLQKDSWTKKESSGRSPWSYKALRSSALGPTMALLRGGNDL